MSSLGRGEGRRHDIDFLRVATFGVLMLYHTSLIYGTKPWIVNADQPSRLIDLVAVASHPWRMSLLFFISGMVCASLLDRKTAGEIRRSRTFQLLPPFVFGVLFIVPPQTYVSELTPFNEHMSYFEFWSGYLLADLRLEHLWFLGYLWLYIFVWSHLHSRLPLFAAKASITLAKTLRGKRLYALPIAFLVLLRLTLFPLFGETLDFVHDYYAHALYFSMFLIGALLFQQAYFWEGVDRQRWTSIAIAALCLLALAAIVVGVPKEERPPELLFAIRVIRSAFQWSVMMAILAFARRLVTRPNPIITYVNKAILTYYVLHQTVLVLIAYWLKQHHLLNGWSFIPVLAATCLFCILAYELKRRCVSVVVHWRAPAPL